MDDTMNRLARELAEAIASAAATDTRVEACREKARSAGYEMRVSLEAIVSFATRTPVEALAKVAPTPRSNGRRALEINANDRRFLRSLRIAVDETPEEVE